MAYHVLINGEQSGPHEVSAIIAMIGRGEVTADTLVWGAGMADWLPARDVAELRTHLGDLGSSESAGRPFGQPVPPLPSQAPAARLDIGRTFGDAFGVIFQQPVKMLILMVVYFVLAIVAMIPIGTAFGLSGMATMESNPSGGQAALVFVAYILFLAVGAALFAGLCWSMVCALRGDAFGIGTLLSGFPRIVPLLLFFVIYGILMSLGFVALVIPGIFLSVVLLLGPLVIMDHRVGPIAAVRGSFRAVMGIGWWRTFAVLILLSLALGAIVAVVAMVFGAGAVFMAAATGDPNAAAGAGASVAGILLIVLIYFVLMAVTAALYSAILASMYLQAQPALDAAADG